MQVKSQPHRLVPQCANIGIPAPAHRVPNLLGIFRANRIALRSGKAFVRLEFRVERLNLQVSAVCLCIDLEGVAFKHKLPRKNAPLFISWLEFRPTVLPQDERGDGIRSQPRVDALGRPPTPLGPVRAAGTFRRVQRR